MFEVVIPSARAANLIPCVRALLAQEPDLPAEHVIVIDDGARADAEAALPGVRWLAGDKPFNFARNVNRGLAAATGDVFLLNDDALLATPHGFSRLAADATREDSVGLCSAAIDGLVGNANQHPRLDEGLREESGRLSFVCVFLPVRTRAVVGLLDEQFAGYGFEDDDYSLRTMQAGLRLAIHDGCIVRHGGELPSTFRVRPDHAALLARNRRLFERKWPTPSAQPSRTWRVRIALPRPALPPAALDCPAFWYLALHDGNGGEIARLDVDRAELRTILAQHGGEIVFERTVSGTVPPAAWTIWPVDRRRRWLERITGTITPETIAAVAA